MNSKFLLSFFSLFFLWLSESNAQDIRTQYFPKEEIQPTLIPAKDRLWVFILAGQSNMAGRGQVEALDTIPDPRIFSINKAGKILVAKEPLHFYEPTLTGLDCGLSFAKSLLPQIPDSVSILIIPTAVGGSSISQWLGDSTFRKVTLFSNFKEKVAIGKRFGEIKGILWHQGETDSGQPETIERYESHLRMLLARFREEVGDSELPVLIGKLGSFSKTNEAWQAINLQIESYVKTDPNAWLIDTSDLQHKGDFVHFDAMGQGMIGQRFAQQWIYQRHLPMF